MRRTSSHNIDALRRNRPTTEQNAKQKWLKVEGHTHRTIISNDYCSDSTSISNIQTKGDGSLENSCCTPICRIHRGQQRGHALQLTHRGHDDSNEKETRIAEETWVSESTAVTHVMSFELSFRLYSM
ncbi:MAG: hypothetical protein ACK5SZ_01335 [bacterium]